MALPAGTENKRQVAIAAALFVIVLGVGSWEVKNYFFSSTPETPRPVAQPAVALHTTARPPAGTPASAGPEAQKITSSNLDPTLHFERLARSEQIEYAGSGRNIFSADSAPVKIEAPLKSARSEANKIDPMANMPHIKEAPKAPPIDLKYFGYTITKDKTIKGYFLRGDDIYAAKPGDIVDHRYKIGALLPGSAQVTDLGYNSTQTLPLTAN
jgi:hypothetical protein